MPLFPGIPLTRFMRDQSAQPHSQKAATEAQLRAAFPDDPEFVRTQVRNRRTFREAVQAKLKAKDAEHEEAIKAKDKEYGQIKAAFEQEKKAREEAEASLAAERDARKRAQSEAESRRLRPMVSIGRHSGGDATDATEDQFKQEWCGSEQLQAEFSTAEQYAAYKKAEIGNQVRAGTA